MHKIAWAKVNVPVDEKIKDLIEALSLFPKLQTIESCQEFIKGKSYVCFQYGNHFTRHSKELTNFVFDFLGPRIVNILGDNIDISVRMGSNGKIFAELVIQNKIINQLTRIIQNMEKNGYR